MVSTIEKEKWYTLGRLLYSEAILPHVQVAKLMEM